MRIAVTAAIALLVAAAPVDARVARVEIDRVALLLGGKAFGEAGAYEWIEGRIHFAFDPASPANARVTDIARAERGSDGLVHAWSELHVLQPADPQRRSGTALIEVVNRGRSIAISGFNRVPLRFEAPRGADPDDPEDWGDGFLMRRGLTLIAIGWQADAPGLPGSLRLRVPTARGPDGTPLRGRARADWVVEAPTQTLELAARRHTPIAAADPAEAGAVLTVRDGREAAREELPRSSWAFARLEGEALVPDPTRITRRAGFEPGRIYELVYTAQDPPVLGLGFAAFRDVIAHARRDPESRFPVERGVAVGISQSGRFLRHFLRDGFNTDERGRRAYDGMMIHIAGAGGGAFNHRFGQPGRVGTRFGSFFYPGDLFPFTSRPTLDPHGGGRAGLLDRVLDAGTAPRIFQINTGYEYWGRAAALVHTRPDGSADVEPADDERLYHIASAPHFSLPFPPDPAARDEDGVYRGSSVETGSITRALLDHLLRWVADDVEPPPSRVPRIDRGTLVSPDAVPYPSLPGMPARRTPHVAYALDFGPRWSSGIIDVQPPRIVATYPALVPTVDSMGNEASGIRPLEVRVPLGTYLPWATRAGLPGPQHELRDFVGTFIPLSRSPAEKSARGDGRPPLQQVYPTPGAYAQRVDLALEQLIAEGFLLPADRESARDAALERWAWIATRAEPAPGPGSAR